MDRWIFTRKGSYLLASFRAVARNTLHSAFPHSIMVMRPLFCQVLVPTQLCDDGFLHKLLTFGFDVFGLVKIWRAVSAWADFTQRSGRPYIHELCQYITRLGSRVLPATGDWQGSMHQCLQGPCMHRPCASTMLLSCADRRPQATGLLSALVESGDEQ